MWITTGLPIMIIRKQILGWLPLSGVDLNSAWNWVVFWCSRVFKNSKYMHSTTHIGRFYQSQRYTIVMRKGVRWPDWWAGYKSRHLRGIRPDWCAVQLLKTKRWQLKVLKQFHSCRFTTNCPYYFGHLQKKWLGNRMFMQSKQGTCCVLSLIHIWRCRRRG